MAGYNMMNNGGVAFSFDLTDQLAQLKTKMALNWKFRCKVTPYVRSHRDPFVRLKMAPWT